MDVYDFPTIFTRYSKKGWSKLISDGHEVNFKLHDGLYMVHVCKATEYYIKSFPLEVLTSYMVSTPKEISGHYHMVYI